MASGACFALLATTVDSSSSSITSVLSGLLDCTWAPQCNTDVLITAEILPYFLCASFMCMGCLPVFPQVILSHYSGW